MFPFLFRSTKCPLDLKFCGLMFHSSSCGSKMSIFRTSCNSKYSDVLISHLFLFSEGNAWVDKNNQLQPREQRSLSSLINYWIVFPATCGQKALDCWKAKEEEGTMKQVSFTMLSKWIFMILPLRHFSHAWNKWVPWESFWLALITVVKNTTSLYKYYSSSFWTRTKHPAAALHRFSTLDFGKQLQY